MSTGFLQILRYFLLGLLWLFFIYAVRMVLVEVRRSRASGDDLDRRVSASDPVIAFSLRVVEPEEARGQVYEFGGEATVGRAPSCGVTLAKDRFVSTVHARLFQHDGELWVEDLGSRNGTYLNNQRIAAPSPLKRGDRVKVGGTLFEVAR